MPRTRGRCHEAWRPRRDRRPHSPRWTRGGVRGGGACDHRCDIRITIESRCGLEPLAHLGHANQSSWTLRATAARAVTPAAFPGPGSRTGRPAWLPARCPLTGGSGRRIKEVLHRLPLASATAPHRLHPQTLGAHPREDVIAAAEPQSAPNGAQAALETLEAAFGGDPGSRIFLQAALRTARRASLPTDPDAILDFARAHLLDALTAELGPRAVAEFLEALTKAVWARPASGVEPVAEVHVSERELAYESARRMRASNPALHAQPTGSQSTRSLPASLPSTGRAAAAARVCGCSSCTATVSRGRASRATSSRAGAT